MKKLIIILAVILAAIIVVGCVLIFGEMLSGNEQQEATVPTTSEATEEETETTAPATEETKPEETAIVTTAGASEEETETTEAPTQEPSTEVAKPTEGSNIVPDVEKESISGTATGSGSFTSSTGTGLDVKVDWQSFQDGGDRKVRLDIYLNCCNLYVGARSGGITIKLGDTTKTLNSGEIDYTGSSTSILIGSIVMDLPEGSTDCTVSWAYRGSYNQIKIDNITAVGTIS